MNIELTDEIISEPVAYLVFNYDKTTLEYTVFADIDKAESYAYKQLCQSCEEGTWSIYPLYASHPIEINK